MSTLNNSDSKYVLEIDDRSGGPLTEKELEHVRKIQSQPGYAEKLSKGLAEIEKEFDLS